MIFVISITQNPMNDVYRNIKNRDNFTVGRIRIDLP